MSAPERVWIDRGPNGGWMKRFEKMPDSQHEYVRTDIAATEADALRAEIERLQAMLEAIDDEYLSQTHGPVISAIGAARTALAEAKP